MSLTDRDGTDHSWWARLARRAARRQRLDGDIDGFEAELTWRADRDGAPPWIETARDLVGTARVAAGKGRLSLGYQALNAARRLTIQGYRPHEVQAAAVGLREEADDPKIKGWRRSSIRRLLAPIGDWSGAAASWLVPASLDAPLIQRMAGVLTADDPTDQRAETIVTLFRESGYEGEGMLDAARALIEESRKGIDPHQVRSLLVDLASCDHETAKSRLREATWIRDEGLANQYRKAELLAENLRVLYAYLLTTILVIVLVAWLGNPNPLEPFGGWMLLLVALFGALGACLSAILSLSRGTLRWRVPQHFTHGVITLFRPLFGAGAALGAHAASVAGIESITSSGVRADNLAPTLVVAFAAGFSELLVLRAVGAVAGKEQESG